MEYYIQGLAEITSGVDVYGNKYMRCSQSIRPLTGSGGWYYPVYAWYIAKEYRTEFTADVSVSTGFREASNVDFYLCGPVDEDYFTIDVDRDTGVPNLPIIAQASIYNPGDLDGDEYDETVTASLNIGSDYGGTELAADEVYVLFIVRKGASTSDGAITATFRTKTYTDDGPPLPDEEWHIFHAPYYNENYITIAYDESNPYSVSNIYLPQYNLLCFRIDNTDASGSPKDGSWTVELSAGANALIYVGTSYRWNSKTGVPAAQGSRGPGTSIKWEDINPAMSYIWIRFFDGASQANVSVSIHFMETQVQTDWHAHVPTISMNNGSVLPVTGSEIWPSGLGEKEVLVYRFKLNENFAPEFSYSGSQSMQMYISTVEAVNSRDGTPNPWNNNTRRGQGSGTNFTMTASQELMAGTWYYLFIRTITGEPYDGQITVTYVTGTPTPPPPPEWSYGDISAQTDILVTTYRDVTLTAQTGVRFRVSFRFSGAASFSVSGDTDAYIYVTTGDYGFSKSTGRPKDINGNELSDGTSTSVFVAGTGYYTYIWVKGQDVDTAGTVTITITPPTAAWTEVEEGEKDITVTDESFIRTYELSVQQVEAYRFDLVFSRSATVQIYSVGSTASSDVMAYFSSVPRTFDRTLGRPDGYDEVWGDAAPGDYNFSGVVDITAGRTYYLWVRGIAADTTAHIWINIAGGGTSGGEKIWIYAGNRWVQATPYVYTGKQWKTATPYVYVSNQWKKCT